MRPHEPETPTDLPASVIQPDPSPLGQLDDDSPPPAKPPGWRARNISWEAPRPTPLRLEPDDIALISAIARCHVAPLEILQPLAFPEHPLKSVQQRVAAFHRRGLVHVGHSHNDTGKPRRKLLATSRPALNAAREAALPYGVPPPPATTTAFRAPNDPSGAHLVRHLQNLTAIAGLVLTAPACVLDWHMRYPATKKRGDLHPVAHLSIADGAGGAIDVTVTRIDDPWHRRTTLHAIRKRFADTRPVHPLPVVLILTPTVSSAREILALADDILAVPDQDAQPARERTLVMPLNRVHLRRRMVLRLSGLRRDQREPRESFWHPYSLLPSPTHAIAREEQQCGWDDADPGEQLELWG